MSEFPDALKQFFNSMIADVHTSIPGEIVKYDPSVCMASVKPLIKSKYRNGDVESAPIIVGVPVIFPRTENASLIFPVSVGDPVLIVFNESNIENFLTLGGEQEPNDLAKFRLSDAVAIPGLYPFTEASPDPTGEDVVLTHSDSEIRLKPDGEISITNGDGALKIGADNLVAFGNSSQELLDIIEQFIQGLVSMTILTGIGAQPPVNIATFTQLLVDIGQIKGTL